MGRFAKLLILVPIAILLGALALANRAPVRLSADPFNATDPALAISVPLFIVVFVTLLLGIALGGAAAWLGQGKWRRAARLRRREVTKLRTEAERRVPEIRPSGGLPASR